MKELPLNPFRELLAAEFPELLVLLEELVELVLAAESKGRKI
jgi:hypothetical protein